MRLLALFLSLITMFACLIAAPPNVTPSTQTVMVNGNNALVFPTSHQLVQVFTSGTRAGTSPVSALQLGYEVDTHQFYYGTGTTAGAWVEVPSGGTWGGIGGTLSDQTDLQEALDAKLDTNGDGSALTGLTVSQITDLASNGVARGTVQFLDVGTGVSVLDYNSTTTGWTIGNAAGFRSSLGLGTAAVKASSLGGNGSADSGKLATYGTSGEISATTAINITHAGDPTQYLQLAAESIAIGQPGTTPDLYIIPDSTQTAPDILIKWPKVTGSLVSTGDTGTVTNTMLAGSIALSKLATDPLARANHTGTQSVSTLTGTLPVANGGTGQSTFTNGQLLIGNTTGNTLAKATLTAGSNVSITNGAGSITIGLTGVQTTSGTLALGGFGAVTGALNIANGGTGQTNAIAALNAFLPPQSGNSGKVLGTNGTDAAWVDDATGGGGGASAPWTWVAGEHSATNGERLLVNTGGGSTIDILLPASPSDLDSVEILDAQVTPFTSTSGANVFSWSKNIIYNGADIGNLASLGIAGTHCICVFSALADKWTISTISGAVSLAGKALDGGTAPDTGWGVVFDALTNKFSFGPPTVLFGAGGFASAPAVRADASAGNPVLGFFGKAASGETLSAQPTAGIAGTGMVFQGGSGFADSGTSITIASDIVTNASTFGGDIGSSAYTINDVVRALKLLGLLAQ